MDFKAIAKWLSENYTWIFSGIGVAAVTGVISLMLKRRSSRQSIGDHAAGIQAGRDIRINSRGDSK
jgi:hypothetical protein